MHRHPRRQWPLAVSLSVLAGFVDAVGYLWLGGFYVSFMSGNSTRLAVGLARNAQVAGIAAGLIVCFVGGVMVATLVGRLYGGGRFRAGVIMAVITAMLAIAAGGAEVGLPVVAVVAMTFAMGAENTVFERDGEASLPVTYMTGALVKLGQRILAAFFGGDRYAWVPHLALWLGLIVGASAGAISFGSLKLEALWIAAAASAGLTIIVVAAATLAEA